MEMRTKYLIVILSICFVVALYAYFEPQTQTDTIMIKEKQQDKKVYGALDAAPEYLKNNGSNSCGISITCPGD